MERYLEEKYLYEKEHPHSRNTGHPDKEDDIVIKNTILLKKGKAQVFDEY